MSTFKNIFVCFFAGFFMVSLIGGCTKKESKEVNLAIWGNYLAPDLVDQFTKETGVKINISNYASNEELLAKVQAGSSGIDVAVPSDYMVQIMGKLELLGNLDFSKIPNRKLVSTDLLNQPFDSKNEFSLPYAWATAGIAVNRDLYKGRITKWKDILDNPELKGKISLLDDVREVMAAALKMNGYKVNTTNKDELEKAKQTLLKARANVKMFRSDTLEALVHKEVAVAHSYSTDANQATVKSGGKIEYILPEDGGTKAMDNLVILKTAKNNENAHKLINFMLSPEANYSFVMNVRAGPVLSTTKAKLPKDLQDNKALFPDIKTLEKYERIEDVGDFTTAYDEAWTAIKTE